MRSDDLDRLDRDIRGASRGPALAYAEVLERAIAVCEVNPDAAAYLEVLEVIARINADLGTTAIVITHNAAIAGMADRVVHLGDGTIQRIVVNRTKLAPSELSW